MSDPKREESTNGEALGCGVLLVLLLFIGACNQGFNTLNHLIDAGWRP